MAQRKAQLHTHQQITRMHHASAIAGYARSTMLAATPRGETLEQASSYSASGF